MTTIIYHNPRCTKSRQTLELLKDNGVNPVVVEYLKTPPSIETLKNIVYALDCNVRDIIRKKESEYAENRLDKDNLSDDEIYKILVKHPKLIERPIVTTEGKAAIGRPPENVLTII